MTGGRLEEAGDRQLGQPLHLSSILIPLPPAPMPPAKADETTIIVITAAKSNFFMTLSPGPHPSERRARNVDSPGD